MARLNGHLIRVGERGKIWSVLIIEIFGILKEDNSWSICIPLLDEMHTGLT